MNFTSQLWLDFEVIRWICHQGTYIDELTLNGFACSIIIRFTTLPDSNVMKRIFNVALKMVYASSNMVRIREKSISLKLCLGSLGFFELWTHAEIPTSKNYILKSYLRYLFQTPAQLLLLRLYAKTRKIYYRPTIILHCFWKDLLPSLI